MAQRLETGFSSIECINTLSMRFNTDKSKVGKFNIWVLPNFDVIQSTVHQNDKTISIFEKVSTTMRKTGTKRVLSEV